MAQETMKLQKKDLNALRRVGMIFDIFANGMSEELKKEAEELKRQFEELRRLSEDSYERGVLKKEHADRVTALMDRAGQLITNRRNERKAKSMSQVGYECSLLDLAEQLMNQVRNGVTPDAAPSGSVWLMNQLLPNLKKVANPRELNKLEDIERFGIVRICDLTSHAIKDMELQVEYAQSKKSVTTEAQYRLKMAESDRKTEDSYVRYLKDAGRMEGGINQLFYSDNYLSNNFKAGHNLDHYESYAVDARGFRPSADNTRDLYGDQYHESMASHFHSKLTTDEQKLDFLVGLSHMETTRQLTGKEVDQFLDLQNGFFFPKNESGQYQLESGLNRMRMLYEYEARVRAQVAREAWDRLSPNGKNELREYNQALANQKPGQKPPKCPKAVRKAYWEARRNHEATLRALAGMHQQLDYELGDNYYQNETARSFSAEFGYSEEQWAAQKRALKAQAEERVNGEAEIYMPQSREAREQFAALGEAQVGTFDAYLARTYDTEEKVTVGRSSDRSKIRATECQLAGQQLTENANARLDLRWFGHKTTMDRARTFAPNDITDGIARNREREITEALDQVRIRDNQNQERIQGDAAATRMLEAWQACDTPGRKAAFVSKLAILEGAGVLTDAEKAAVDHITDSFFLPQRHGGFDQAGCEANMKAFRRLMDANAAVAGTRAAGNEQTYAQSIEQRDRRSALATHMAMHTTNAGATLEMQKSLLNRAMERLPKHTALRLRAELKSADAVYCQSRPVPQVSHGAVSRGLGQRALPANQLPGGQEELVEHQQCLRNRLRNLACVDENLPTWRMEAGQWKQADKEAFRADTMTKMENAARNITPEMVADLNTLADEIKDADRFFYINGGAYRALRDTLRAAADKARELQQNNTLNTEQGRQQLQPLLTAVDRACGAYILSHSADRHSRHGNRRFNVALMTNALLNPAAADTYNRIAENSRGGVTINYQELKERLNLNTQVSHPAARQQQMINGQRVSQAQNNRSQNQMG